MLQTKNKFLNAQVLSTKVYDNKYLDKMNKTFDG